MPGLIFKKHIVSLTPADEQTADYVSKLKTGQVVRAKISKIRNYVFLKKYMALINFAFENMEKGDIQYKGQRVEPNFDEFRANLAILAGFYVPVYDLQGVVHLRAKSISFAKMDADEFEQLYSKTIDVILRKVLTRYTEDELQNTVNELMSFA